MLTWYKIGPKLAQGWLSTYLVCAVTREIEHNFVTSSINSMQNYKHYKAIRKGALRIILNRTQWPMDYYFHILLGWDQGDYKGAQQSYSLHWKSKKSRQLAIKTAYFDTKKYVCIFIFLIFIFILIDYLVLTHLSMKKTLKSRIL